MQLSSPFPEAIFDLVLTQIKRVYISLAYAPLKWAA
jgi:hypothetical protein